MQPASSFHSQPKFKFEVSTEVEQKQENPEQIQISGFSGNPENANRINKNNPGKVVILNPPTHTCFACPKAFNHKWMLDRHILTHTGEQPFACSICLRRFSLQASCLRHVRHVHKNVDGLIGNYVVKVNELENPNASENIQS